MVHDEESLVELLSKRSFRRIAKPCSCSISPTTRSTTRKPWRFTSLPQIIRSMPLHLLRLCGNPIVSIAEHYRKLTIFAMPTLNYLDESPVFEKERRLAAAFTQGGIEAEKQQREDFKKEETEKRAMHRKAFQDLVEKCKGHQPSTARDFADNVYETLKKEARERDLHTLGCYPACKTVFTSFDRPTPSTPITHSVAKKRGANQLDEDDKIESPQKLLKITSSSEDEMEVEAAVSRAARDFMDFDCGLIPAVEMEECAYERSDESTVAELNIPIEEDFEVEPSMVISPSKDNPDDTEDPWLRLVPDLLRECVEKERMHKKNRMKKVLQKTASDAEDGSESRKRFMQGPDFVGEGNNASPLRSSRPVIWGSAIYRGLWAKAVNINDNVEPEAIPLNSLVLSTPDISYGACISTDDL